MKLKFDSREREIDLDKFTPQDGMLRVLVEPTPNPRVYLKKYQQLLHQKNTSLYLLQVQVIKFIDDKQVNSYSWIEPLNKEELQEFKDYLLKQKKAEKLKLYHKNYNKTYYQNNKEKIKQITNTYYHTHKEEYNAKRKEYFRLYKQNHSEENKTQCQSYYQQHRDQIIQRCKNYYYQNKDKLKESRKTYYQNNKDKWKLYQLHKLQKSWEDQLKNNPS